MTKEEWIKEAEERIKSHIEFIDEVNDMCGTDWSRHRSQKESSELSVKFLKIGIKLLKGQENVK
jgi:hypothetical protein